MSSKSNDGYNQFPECGNVSVKEEPSTKFDPNDPLQILPDFTSPDMLFEGVQSDDSDDTSNTEPSTSKISKLDGSNSFLEAMEVGDLSYQRREKVQRIWTDIETKFLLKLYAKYLTEIGPMKRFRNKKQMWAEIATKIPGMTATQCLERVKTIMKRKRNRRPAIKVSKRNGEVLELESNDGKYIVEFHSEELDVPENDIDTSRTETPPVINEAQTDLNYSMESRNNSVSKSQQTEIINQQPIVKKIITLEETLLAIADRREEARERRHREKMEATKETQNILRQILAEVRKSK
ncbi:uncharacterized protein LOC142229535 isoform X2 [Haematobia irritans]|uniref:uncharacterized protein LOC142229535 isoform X2 n=1 Tax=Haematobia irritans TaxID=7368 RepID=UPI003F50B451